MNIKFKYYELIVDRNETDVEETLKSAVADCVGPGRRTTLLPKGANFWESGKVGLMVQPEHNCESAIA